MPIFGKSRHEKALEERENFLRYIQNALGARIHQTPPNRNWDALLSDLQEQLLKKGQDIFTLEGEQAINFAQIPDDLGEAKYYFLRAVSRTALVLFASSHNTNRVFHNVAYGANQQLMKYLVNSGNNMVQRKDYANAEREYTAALAIAQDKAGDPSVAALCLRNLGACAWNSGRKQEAQSKLNEAINYINDTFREDPDLPSFLREQLQQMLGEYRQMLAQMGG